MKKLTILCLCLLLLTGCVSLPNPRSERGDAPATVQEAAQETPPVPDASPEPEPTASPSVTCGVTLSPSPEPPAATPEATQAPLQTYEGAYFRFQAPGEWLQARVEDGVFFYPDLDDTDHTCLSYQEVPNDMNLTETMVDLALFFSSDEAITSMVEGALTSNGVTGFTLSPVSIQKTKLNGTPCYRGASDVTVNGETYDFVGHIFLRGEKLVLLIWVGDQTAYADGLKVVYDSLQPVQ